jgi:heme/copper-type cytochrome/quinol oxidase subunit 2
MRIPVNPFWLFVAVALVVLVAIVLISYRRNETQALTAKNEPGATIRSDALPTVVVVLALAVILVPFGIAAAALGGPEAGVVAYGVLLAGTLIGRAMWRR